MKGPLRLFNQKTLAYCYWEKNPANKLREDLPRGYGQAMHIAGLRRITVAHLQRGWDDLITSWLGLFGEEVELGKSVNIRKATRTGNKAGNGGERNGLIGAMVIQGGKGNALASGLRKRNCWGKLSPTGRVRY